jgi:TonB family protein
MSVRNRCLQQGLRLALLVLALGGQLIGQKNDTITDDQIKVIDFQEMRYPLAARLSHVEGIVVVKATLNGSGQVASASAISGPKPLIADVLKNAEAWRFKPNAQASVIIVYRFRIHGLCHGTGSSQFIFEPPNFASVTSCDGVVEP